MCPPLSVALAQLTAADLAAAPRYTMKLGSASKQGVKKLSLVETPAIETGWVALSAATASGPKRYHLSAATEGAPKQVLTGPALIPGQEILRLSEDKKPFYIRFDEETIEAAARRFAAEGQHSQTNDSHALDLSGNLVYESWLVADPKNDKAAALGIDVPAGTWMLSLHVPDADYWEKEVVSGNRTGFSIEGVFDKEEITLAALPAPKSPMKKNWLFALAATMASKLGIKFSKVELKNGDIVDVAEDGTVSLLDADGNVTGAAPDGNYDPAEGEAFDVKDGKKVAAVAAAEDAPTDEKPDTAAVIKTLTTVVEGGETDVDALKKAVAEAIKALGGEATPAASKPEEVKASAMQLFLEAVEMADGTSMNWNPISRLLTDANGVPVASGYHACKDGSFFRVETSQYTYTIDAETYANATTQLSAVQTQLAAAKLELSKTPDGQKLHLSAESTGTPPVTAKPKTTAERYAFAAAQAETVGAE